MFHDFLVPIVPVLPNVSESLIVIVKGIHASQVVQDYTLVGHIIDMYGGVIAHPDHVLVIENMRIHQPLFDTLEGAIVASPIPQPTHTSVLLLQEGGFNASGRPYYHYGGIANILSTMSPFRFPPVDGVKVFAIKTVHRMCFV